jgi:hypothetical protein
MSMQTLQIPGTVRGVIHGFTLLTAVLLMLWQSIHAAQASPAQDRLLPAFAIKPAAGGWMQPSGNMGNINFDISDSGVAAGNWSTYSAGEAVWYYFQGNIEYRSDADIRSDGIIATVESPLLKVVRGSPCLTCSYEPAQLAADGNTLRIEFTSSRTGRFIYNGTTSISIVAWMQGLPLFVPRDYSGDWLAIARLDREGSGSMSHMEAAAHLKLEMVSGPEHYRTLYPWAVPDTDDFVPPQEGARRYRVTCVGPLGPNSPCELMNLYSLLPPIVRCTGAPPSCPTLPTPENQFVMLWINPDETGRMELAAVDGSDGYAFLPQNTLFSRTYGERDRLLLRKTSVGYVGEIVLERLTGGDVSGNDWYPLRRIGNDAPPP